MLLIYCSMNCDKAYMVLFFTVIYLILLFLLEPAIRLDVGINENIYKI